MRDHLAVIDASIPERTDMPRSWCGDDRLSVTWRSRLVAALLSRRGRCRRSVDVPAAVDLYAVSMIGNRAPG